MTIYHRFNPDGPAKDRAVVLAFMEAHGSAPRSDIWQGLHGQVTVGHVDPALEALLAEGRIRAMKVSLSRPQEGPWRQPKFVRYVATVYEAVRDAE